MDPVHVHLCAGNQRAYESRLICESVVGPGDTTETKISAHRFVLCCRSPVFHRTLQWGAAKAPADKKLKENDIAADVFREILRSALLQLRVGNSAVTGCR